MSDAAETGVALVQVGQPVSWSSSQRLPLVGALDVRLEEAVEGDHPAADAEKTTSRPSDAAPPIRTVTDWPTASFIWEATVRIQISS